MTSTGVAGVVRAPSHRTSKQKLIVFDARDTTHDSADPCSIAAKCTYVRIQWQGKVGLK
jgi:hypothetical protein